jgi:hypothetical protein
MVHGLATWLTPGGRRGVPGRVEGLGPRASPRGLDAGNAGRVLAPRAATNRRPCVRRWRPGSQGTAGTRWRPSRMRTPACRRMRGRPRWGAARCQRCRRGTPRIGRGWRRSCRSRWGRLGNGGAREGVQFVSAEGSRGQGSEAAAAEAAAAAAAGAVKRSREGRAFACGAASSGGFTNVPARAHRCWRSPGSCRRAATACPFAQTLRAARRSPRQWSHRRRRPRETSRSCRTCRRLGVGRAPGGGGVGGRIVGG